MSRTYRRKNYEDTQGTSWDRKGRKTAGYYTEYDYNDSCHFWHPGWNRGDVTYRPPTQEEYIREHQRIHGESKHANYWTPGKGYKQHRMNENRQINKQELVKWKKRPDDYEPLFEEEPRNHWWDWS